MKKILVLGMLTAMLLLTGCATMFTGSTDTVLIDSTPSASYTVKNRSGLPIATGKTPDTLVLKRNDSYVIEIKLEGYQTKTLPIVQEFNPASILNFGNVLFWGIDYLTGGLFHLFPRAVNVTLEVAVVEVDNGAVAHVNMYQDNNLIATNSAELSPLE
ncbi:MAG: hypothetical protein WCY21_02540 [Candidatus Cloacimonadaceae bacterium]|jgi:hypothetical protein|nr:hypothetical protein [Candidatus Cloacimonadota bacterium]MDX9949671.1 hypothetical protein [Candidatus Syntrophosphaera sp.]NLN85801.1 hypothetical protein [Candidatus Cloacimonadota bacterium]